MTKFNLAEQHAIARCNVWLCCREVTRIRKDLNSASELKSSTLKRLLELQHEFSNDQSEAEEQFDGARSDRESLSQNLAHVDAEVKKATHLDEEGLAPQLVQRQLLSEQLLDVKSRCLRWETQVANDRIVLSLVADTIHADNFHDDIDIEERLKGVSDPYVSREISTFFHARHSFNSLTHSLAEALHAREEARRAATYAGSRADSGEWQDVDEQEEIRFSRSFPLQPFSAALRSLKSWSWSEPPKTEALHRGRAASEFVVPSDESMRNVLVNLCQHIRDSGLVRDRRVDRQNLVLTFTGAELLTWMVKSDVVQDRGMAFVVGRLLHEREFVYHVEGTSTFKDEFEFYRFKCDDADVRQVAKRGWLWHQGRWRTRMRYVAWDAERHVLSVFRSGQQCMGSALEDVLLPETATVERAADVKNRFEFVVRSPSSTTLVKLAAATDRERKEWMRALSAALCTCGHSPDHLEHCARRVEGGSRHRFMAGLTKRYSMKRARHKLEFATMFSQMQRSPSDALSSLATRVRELAAIVGGDGSTELEEEDQAEEEMEEDEVDFDRQPCQQCLREGLEALLHSRSPLSRLVHEFQRLFLSTYSELTVSDMPGEAVDRAIQDAVDDIRGVQGHLHRLVLNALGQEASLSMSLLDLVEQCLSRALFSADVAAVLFPLYEAKNAVSDGLLQECMHECVSLSAADLGVAKELCLDAPVHGVLEAGCAEDREVEEDGYQMAVQALQLLSSLHDPQEKLSCVVSVADRICHCVDVYRSRCLTKDTQDGPLISADDLLLLFALVICRSGIGNLHAHMHLMQDYITPQQTCMMAGYYLTTLQASVQLLLTRDFECVTAHQEQQ